MVKLNVALNTSDRVSLSNIILSQSLAYNSTSLLISLQIIMDPTISNNGKKGKNSSFNIIDDLFLQLLL